MTRSSKKVRRERMIACAAAASIALMGSPVLAMADEAPQVDATVVGEAPVADVATSQVVPQDEQGSPEAAMSGSTTVATEGTGKDASTPEASPIDATDANNAADASNGATAEGTAAPDQAATVAETPSEALPSIEYQTHVQDDGWQEYVSNGATAGTFNRSLRLEGLRVRIVGADGQVIPGISYKAHVQDYGWQDWASDDELIGTTGLSLRVEALRIKLSDELAQKYDVLYRTHIEDYGWLDWAANGEPSGSAGESKRIEAIEIKLQEKGQPIGEGGTAFVADPVVLINGHVQDIGWQGLQAGETGTNGQSLRMEAVTAQLSGVAYPGSIVYQAHVQDEGWQAPVADGGMAGSEGMSRRVEAFNFHLEGEVADYYDVYYRAHVQDVGWLGWAANGQNTGSEGFSKRMESLQVRLVPKDSGAPSYDGSNVGGTFFAPTSIVYDSSADGTAWAGTAADGEISGDHKGGIVDQLKAGLVIPEGSFDGDLTYAVRSKDGTWADATLADAVAGTAGTDVNALSFSLSGDLSAIYDVVYQAHLTDRGWLSWASNGEEAGTSATNAGVDAFRVMLVAKGEPMPADDDVALASFFVEQGSSDSTTAPKATVVTDENRDEVIDTYVDWAVDIANDDSHGYSQGETRWSPDYDCSSLVISALNAAGLNTGEATYTGNMLPELTKLGWEATGFKSQDQLKRGDILLNPEDHTELYIGDGKNVAAWMSETGGIFGQVGDQTGSEILVTDYHDNFGAGWDYVLRLK